MRARKRALPPNKIPVGGGSTALLWSHLIRVHAQAHGTAGFAPLKARFDEYTVKAFFFRLMSDKAGTGHNQGLNNGVCNLAAFDDLSGRTQILNPGVSARSDEDAVLQSTGTRNFGSKRARRLETLRRAAHLGNLQP